MPTNPMHAESSISTAAVPDSHMALIELTGITKRFPGVVANDNVSISIAAGAFHAIIGENGAGKSTLLNVLYGRYSPDHGVIKIAGNDVTDSLHGPTDAIHLGIGLVSQHYALIPALSVLENIMLGSEPDTPGSVPGFLNRRTAGEKVKQLAAQLGLEKIPLHESAGKLSVAAQQKVEILKALYRDARILLLDEPTATLAPPEAAKLFELLESLKERGTTVVFVTHKLKEVLRYSTAVSVLRGGRNAGDFQTSETNDRELVTCMIGARAASSTSNFMASDTESRHKDEITRRPILSLSHLVVNNARGVAAVNDASITLNTGEILGIAGVDGSGQKELSEAIVGLRSAVSGTITLHSFSSSKTGVAERSLNGLSVRARQRAGISYIPEDRHRSAMILDFTVGENYLLGREYDRAWGGGLILNAGKVLAHANSMISKYDVRMGARDATVAAGALSGGNQQKVVIARALENGPSVLIACQPTRGLDTGATAFVYDSLRRLRNEGGAILLFSLDLDEVLELSDRVAVMFNGRIVKVLDRADATPDRLGALMTGSATGELEPAC